MRQKLPGLSIGLLLGLSAWLIIYLLNKYLPYASFLYSYLLNFSLMASYTLIVSRLNPKLNSSWFSEHRIEKSGRLYTYLGIHLYRRLLVLVGWEKVTRMSHPIKKDRMLMSNYEYQTRISEFGHLLIAIIILFPLFYYCESLAEARWLILTNILLNIYPILVQRYNRPRIKRLLESDFRSKNGLILDKSYSKTVQ